MISPFPIIFIRANPHRVVIEYAAHRKKWKAKVIQDNCVALMHAESELAKHFTPKK